MDDLISRKAAIDALGKDPGFKVKLFGKSYDEGRSDQWFKDVHVLTALPSAQPDHNADVSKKVEGDCISRKAALKICRRYWHPTYNPIMEEIEKLPSVQQEQRWIPVTERLPENDNEVLITVWDAEDDYVEVYKGFYQGHEWWTQWCHGCSKIKDEPCGENIVIAWRPLPEPYEVK